MAVRDTSALPVNILIRGGQQYKAAKKEVDKLAAFFATGATANDVIGAVHYLKSVLPALQAVTTAPGMLEIAQAQYGDTGYDVVTEMGVLVSAIETAVTDIVALFPTQGNYILTHSYNAQNELVPRAFTGAQLAPLIAKLNEISAAVE